ncbi:MAG: CPBP family intramembrane glutamic endopeptidase [Phycisphaerales bacterium]
MLVLMGSMGAALIVMMGMHLPANASSTAGPQDSIDQPDGVHHAPPEEAQDEAAEETVQPAEAVIDVVEQPPLWGAMLTQAAMAVGSVVVMLIVMRRRWFDLKGEPQGLPPLILVPLALFLLIFVAQGVGMSIAAAMLMASDGTTGEAETLNGQNMLRLGAYLAALPFIVATFWWWRSQPAVPQAPARVSIGKAIVYGGIGVVMIWPLVQMLALAGGLVEQVIFHREVDSVAHETLDMLQATDDRGAKLLAMVLVVVGAPIVEEVMYRSLLQRGLQQLFLSNWLGIVGSASIFTLMHIGAVDAHALPVMLLLGIGFGLVYHRSGRLLAAIVMHSAFNGLNLTLAMLG